MLTGGTETESLLGYRQPDRKYGSTRLFLATTNLDLPAVQGNNTMNQRQPKSASLCAAGIGTPVQLLKNFGDILSRDTRPRIRHLD